MNVAQLIKKLKTYKPDAEVRFVLPEPLDSRTNFWVDEIEKESHKGSKDNIILSTNKVFDEDPGGYGSIGRRMFRGKL